MFPDRKLLNRPDRKLIEVDGESELSSDCLFRDDVTPDDGRDEGQKLFLKCCILDEFREIEVTAPPLF